MKYASIEVLWQSAAYGYSLETVCVAHGVSRQAFYQYQQRQANERLKQEIAIQLVCQIRWFVKSVHGNPESGCENCINCSNLSLNTSTVSWDEMHCSACSERMDYSVHHQNVDTAPLVPRTDFIGIPIASWI